ncbi:MAG TPA: hypothetical protein PLZ84_06575 [Clostridia bacterium]|nr:hypothetical protein [Clostridia bacterium]
MALTVRQIKKNELDKFLKLPFRLYRNDPNWVPPLLSEYKNMLDPAKNTFLAGGEHAYFMAFDGKRAVARILAGRNTPVTNSTGIKTGYFSLFEARDERSGLAVLEAAADYCRSLGLERIIGPYSPTNGEEERALLVEGFDMPPVLYTTYNPPWYSEAFEKFGLKKSSDLLAFILEADKLPLEKFRRVVRLAEQRYCYKANSVRMDKLDDELKDIQRILNEAGIEDWDMGIPSWDMIRQAAASLKTLADPDFVQIVRKDDGRPLAFVVAVPNYNEVLIHMNGRLFPFGFLQFLYWRKKIKGLRIMMQFCVKDYQGSGAVSSAYLAIMEKALEKGYTWGEASTIGEDNLKSLLAVKGAGGRVYRRYRRFEKDISV